MLNASKCLVHTLRFILFYFSFLSFLFSFWIHFDSVLFTIFFLFIFEWFCIDKVYGMRTIEDAKSGYHFLFRNSVVFILHGYNIRTTNELLTIFFFSIILVVRHFLLSHSICLDSSRFCCLILYFSLFFFFILFCSPFRSVPFRFYRFESVTFAFYIRLVSCFVGTGTSDADYPISIRRYRWCEK